MPEVHPIPNSVNVGDLPLAREAVLRMRKTNVPLSALDAASREAHRRVSKFGTPYQKGFVFSVTEGEERRTFRKVKPARGTSKCKFVLRSGS